MSKDRSADTAIEKPLVSEDWLAVLCGLAVFFLSLGLIAGRDLLGWSVKTNVWLDWAKIVEPVSKAYAGLSAPLSLLATFGFLLVLTTAGALLMRLPIAKFMLSFTVVFSVSFACMAAGSYAYIAATQDKLQGFGIGWSLNLTGEAGFIIALLAGLFVGNVLPGFTNAIKTALRPEWYIKTAVVILGGFMGAAAIDNHKLASAVMFRGLCAIVEAYLIYWAIVYYVARRFFGFSREWAVPLASGISICGVAAAISTGAAIRARPIVPIMVSSLVVIFATVELLVLPFAAQHFLYKDPLVAGAWMGLSVKTDGAAVAAGAITDSLIRAKMTAVEGHAYEKDWVTNTATTVKVFIDIFIGIWSFILAVIWSTYIDRRKNDKVRIVEIWQRFPKFVLGYLATFLVAICVGVYVPGRIADFKAAMGEANVYRGLLFAMTFFSIGAVSNLKRLWREGIARLAAVYFVCLFGFVIWIGLLISWLFFHGEQPPIH